VLIIFANNGYNYVEFEAFDVKLYR